MTDPISTEEAIETVERDVTDVLNEMLPATEGFRLAPAFDPEVVGPITTPGQDVAVVAWEWAGRNEGLFGLDPTHRPVTVRGVSLVTRGERGEVLLHRHVDWLDVLNQAGIAVNTRPIVDVVSEIADVENEPLVADALARIDQT